MPEIITIDDWNDRLAPRNTDDSDAEGGDCGCCLMPKCCPPQLECQSVRVSFGPEGFYEFGQSDSWPRYRKSGETTTVEADVTTTYDEPGNDIGETVGSTHVVSAESFSGFEQEQLYSGGVTTYGSTSGSDGCPFWPYVPPVETCTASGTSTYTSYDWKFWGETPPFNQDYAASYTWTETIESAEGDTTEAFTAWRDLYPTDGDYDAAVAAYAAYLEAQAEYEEAWAEWDAGGQVGPEPEPPDPVDEPTSRPDEFYGPCWFKIVLAWTVYAHYFGKNSDGSSAEPSGPGIDTVQDWMDNGLVGDPPQSGTGTIISQYTQTPISALSKPSGTSITTTNGESEPFTKEEWLAIVKAVADEVIGDFPEEGCYSSECSAQTDFSGDFYIERAFRYRWKLNKCCGLYAGLSWLEVFYPDEFLAWSGSDEPPVIPTDTARAWEWTGGGSDIASDCDGSGSIDPFDDQERWSPWSLTVRTPSLEAGVTYLRSLYMVCYRSDYGTKPDFIPLYGEYNESTPTV